MTVNSPLGSASVVLDAAGAGTVRVGPDVYGYVWNVNGYSTFCTASCSLLVYRQVVSASAMIDQTGHGESNASDTQLTLRAGEDLVAVYSGGTPGTVATFNVTGEQVRQ